jgi:hypothetical protein
MTTITIIFWVFFGVYSVLVTKPPLNVPAEILDPVSATLDSQTLGRIEQRVFFEEVEIESLVVQTTPTPLPTPTAETTTEEAESQATESATATPSAESQTE